MLDLISLGDSTIDTFIKIHEADVECDLNKEDCKICIPYGAKIPVDSIGYGVAGNAANVAVGASTLGLSTAIYTNLGDDDQGQTIKQAFEKAGVILDYVRVIKDKNSNLSVVLTFQGERTIFVYHQDWVYSLPTLTESKWAYFTSMAQTFAESNILDEIYHWVTSSKTKLIFAPGTFQLKAGIKRFSKILENCELIIVNMEEAKTVLGIDQSQKVEPKDILSKLLLLGVKKAVVTDGGEGSYGTDGQNNFKLGIFPTTVAEKTGAGDAYSSGLIAGLCSDLPFEEAMVWGAINSAHVVQKIGTQSGLLTREEIIRTRAAIPQLKSVSF